jgi:hypothetical protein
MLAMKIFINKSLKTLSAKTDCQGVGEGVSLAEDVLEIHMQCSNVSACDLAIQAKSPQDELEIHMRRSNVSACDLAFQAQSPQDALEIHMRRSNVSACD